MEKPQQRAAALLSKPTTAFATDRLDELPGINSLTADERTVAVTSIINDVRESLLARALWSINNRAPLLIPDTEAVSAELVSLRVVSALRGLNNNASHDRLLNHLADDIHDATNQINNIIRLNERTLHANLMANLGQGNAERRRRRQQQR